MVQFLGKVQCLCVAISAASLINFGVLGSVVQAQGGRYSSSSFEVVILSSTLASQTGGTVNRTALSELLNYFDWLGFSSVRNLSRLIGNPNLFVEDAQNYIVNRGFGTNIDQFLNGLERYVLIEAINELSPQISWDRVNTISDLFDQELRRLGINNISDLVRYGFQATVRRTNNQSYYELERMLLLALRAMNIQEFNQIPELDRRLKAMGLRDFSLSQTLNQFIAQKRQEYFATLTPPAASPTSGLPVPSSFRPNNVSKVGVVFPSASLVLPRSKRR